MSYNLPDENGHFDQYGGIFVAETLMSAVTELNEAYEKYKDDPEFLKEFEYDLKHYVGRETPLYYAENLTKKIGGAKIYLKREDLNHTGAHKVNNQLVKLCSLRGWVKLVSSQKQALANMVLHQPLLRQD